jgi:PAS domain S-box-containing protein
LKTEFETLAELLKSKPKDVKKLAQLDALVRDSQRLLAVSATSKPRYEDLPMDELKKTLRAAIALRRQILLSQYGSLKPTRDDMSSEHQKKQHTIILLLFGMAILLFGLTITFLRDILSRLNVVRDNTVLLTENRPLKPEVKGNDEIADVDSSFRAMASLLAESSRKERALIDNATSVLASLDKELNFIKVSQVCQKSWGYEVDDLVGSNFSKLFGAQNYDDKTEFQSLIQTNKNKTFDRKLTRADGSEIDVRWELHWAESENSFFCVATDVTKEKELERMKQQLLDTVAHDLRSPMTSIRTTLNLIRLGVMGEIPEAVGLKIERVEQQSDRLIRLINDLLDFERLDSGSLTLYVQPVPVGTLIAESFEAVSASAAQAKVTLENTASELVVDGDSDRLIQVLVNLISNAIKFSPEGETVSVNVEKNGSMARLSVSDRGPGVPEEFQESIFERFKMVEGSAAHKKAGTGLGLAICKQIIDLHKGEIGVSTNQNGTGSTFWFTVPISKAV